MNGLSSYFSKYAPMSRRCCDDLLDIAQHQMVLRKEHLFTAGQVCDKFCFAESGLLRGYYKQGNKEVTVRFMREGDCCITPESFYHQVKGTEYVQALEDSLIYFVSYRELQLLFHEHPELNASARIWTEVNRVLYERRVEGMWKGHARGRYNWLMQRFPDLLKRVPGKHLASYLGISEVKMSQMIHGG